MVRSAVAVIVMGILAIVLALSLALDGSGRYDPAQLGNGGYGASDF